MAFKLIISDIVLQDVEDAFQWYEEQQVNTGKRFVLELKDLLTLIKNAPELFAEIKPNVRRAVFKNFPFNVYFKIEKDELGIIGIMHQKRNPSLIKKRLKK